MVTAWLYDDSSNEDPRMPHQFTPNKEVSLEELAEIGVLHWKFNPETELDKVQELMKERNYSSSDQVKNTVSLWQFWLGKPNKRPSRKITISKEKLPNYEEKLKTFFTE